MLCNYDIWHSYTIELKHGPFKWTIRKTYRAFRSLKDDMRHWRNENVVVTTSTNATPSPRGIKYVGMRECSNIKSYRATCIVYVGSSSVSSIVSIALNFVLLSKNWTEKTT